MDVDMEAAEADQNGDDDDEDDDEDMPEFFKDAADPSDTKTPSRNPKSKVALVVRVKINKVLAETELADKRSRQCDQNDFLRLLLGRLRPCHVWVGGGVLTGCSVPQGGDSFLVRDSGLGGRRSGVVGSWGCRYHGAESCGHRVGQKQNIPPFLEDHCAHMMSMGLLHHGVPYREQDCGCIYAVR